MTTNVRRISPRDHSRWLELWEGYCRFYERQLSEPKTRHNWARIMDRGSPVHAIVAERAGDGVIGMANYIIHENTWELTPVCYLQDLFVDRVDEHLITDGDVERTLRHGDTLPPDAQAATLFLRSERLGGHQIQVLHGVLERHLLLHALGL